LANRVGGDKTEATAWPQKPKRATKEMRYKVGVAVSMLV
jgi:hypothetical protein